MGAKKTLGCLGVGCLGIVLIFVAIMIGGAFVAVHSPVSQTQSNSVQTPSPHQLTESEIEDLARPKILIKDWAWHKGGFDNVLLASFKIENGSDCDIKDPVVSWRVSGNSGTRIGNGKETIYEAIPAHSSLTIKEMNFGLIAGQASKSGADVTGFEIVGFRPPPTSEELAEMAKAAQAQAVASKKARAAKIVEGTRKALEFDQKLSDQGDPYYQFKMGMRYLAGDGVPKDLVKAKDLLSKSAVQGNKDAADQLAKLPSP